MLLKSLYLRNFRNYGEVEIPFFQGMNHISGDNGQGKTNLLEAIAFLSTGRSFRTQHLSELIRHEADAFLIEARLMRDGVEQTLRITFDGRERRLTLNHTAHTSFTPLLGLLPSVTLVPSDAEIIDGAPSARRRFLNIHLAQSDPLYVHHLLRYSRALKQRNALLRQRNSSLRPWEAMLIPSGLYLSMRRKELLSTLQIEYDSATPPNPTAYEQQLERTRDRDLILGATQIGPHRDDFTVMFNGHPARTYGSEGQKRMALAQLKFAEWDRLRAQLDAPPLFILDDFGLHLDEAHRTELASRLSRLGQVFLSAPVEIPIPPTHHIEKGVVKVLQPA